MDKGATQVACFLAVTQMQLVPLQGLDTASTVCPEVSGAGAGACHLSSSLLLGNVSRPSRLGRASWNYRADTWKRNYGTGAGVKVVPHTCIRKATNGSLPPAS